MNEGRTSDHRRPGHRSRIGRRRSRGHPDSRWPYRSGRNRPGRSRSAALRCRRQRLWRPASSTCTCTFASPASNTPRTSKPVRAPRPRADSPSICCMPNTSPVNDSATVTSFIVQRAREVACVNVFPIGAITKGSLGEELAAIGSMREAGIVAISDDGRPVMNARVMRRAMELARRLRYSRDRSLRGSRSERRRRYARGRGIRAARLARHSVGL